MNINIKNFFKKLFKITSIFFVLIILIIVFYNFKNQYEKKIEDKVKVVSYRSIEHCGDDNFPFYYEIVNESDRTVLKVAFAVNITKKGYSNVINSYTELVDYKILEPNEKVAACYNTTYSDYKKTDKYITERDVDINIYFKRVTFKDKN